MNLNKGSENSGQPKGKPDQKTEITGDGGQTAKPRMNLSKGEVGPQAGPGIGNDSKTENAAKPSPISLSKGDVGGESAKAQAPYVEPTTEPSGSGGNGRLIKVLGAISLLAVGVYLFMNRDDSRKIEGDSDKGVTLSNPTGKPDSVVADGTSASAVSSDGIIPSNVETPGSPVTRDTGMASVGDGKSTVRTDGADKAGGSARADADKAIVGVGKSAAKAGGTEKAGVYTGTEAGKMTTEDSKSTFKAGGTDKKGSVATDARAGMSGPVLAFFPPGSANPLSIMDFKIVEIRKHLESNTKARLEVSGHASMEGDPGFNQSLTESRAAEMRRFLIGKGIPGSRIDAVGAGTGSPMADNSTDTGRRKNRRVEYRIVE